MASILNPVFFYIPNLIGYGRIVLALAALYIIKTSGFWSILFYVASCLLDAADGFAARYYGQSSNFGAVLDMVTDRYVCYLSVNVMEYMK
jgi:CDP-diacylglycerol--inositol 3-phosphatidyltransferase